MICPGYSPDGTHTPCGKPSRRPNGYSEGSQYCGTCWSRFYWHRRKATDPDFAEQHLTRIKDWQSRNRTKARAYTNNSYRRQKAAILATLHTYGLRKLRDLLSIQDEAASV